MRILQILPELNVGGVETGTVDFAKYLKDHGHGSIVVSNGGGLVKELLDYDIRHYELPVHKKNIFTAWTCIEKLRDIILTEKIDIVHARSRVPAWISYFACRRTPAQLITTCHGHYSVSFYSKVMAFPKLIIVPSKVIGRHMIERFHVSPESVRHIPRSVDLERFQVRRQERSGSAHFVVTIVGRLSPIKGHVYFLKAMSKVVRSMPYLKVRIVGDASPGKESYKQELVVLTRHLGLSEHVEFLGNRRDVPQILADSDVLVLASVVPEAFGRVVLEAQAAGVPVVATKVGGVVEIIDDEKTGLLVLPRDTDGMAQAVLRLLNDRKLAREISFAARKKIEDCYTLEHMASQTVAVYEELLAHQNILVIKLSAIGDVVLITASLKALRKKFPQARICCLVGDDSKAILQKCPYIDELIVMDVKERDKDFWAFLKFSRKLTRYRFDKVIDFQNNRRSHLLAFLCFARNVYGFRNRKFGFFVSDPADGLNADLPPVEHQFQILKLLGIAYDPNLLLELHISDPARKKAQALLDSVWINDSVPLVGINIAASDKWKSKNWPVEHIAKLCDLLAVRNIRVVITGTDKDRPLVTELLKLTRSKPAILVGKTSLMELASVIKRCQVYVSPDSCPLHLAASVRTPFVALFGPTSSRRHLPPSRRYIVLERPLSCAPCYSGTCKIFTHVCMKDISAEEVLAAVDRLMEPASGGGT